MADNISPIIFGAMIGHLASKGHRPRWTSLAMFLSGVACVFGALPYFFFGPVTTIYYSAGTAYLDDNVERRKAPIYMTLSTFLRGIGPVIGFVLSSACLAIYEDPQHPPDYDSEDSRWIGAWWIGFIVLGGFQFVFTAPLLLFPKRIKKLPEATTTFHESGMLPAMLRLFRNPIYMLHMFSQIFKWFGILGYFNYLPKYIQEQFHVSASSAALYGGSLPIALSLLPVLLGGITIRYWKPNPRLLTFIMFLLEVATIILFLTLGSFRCEAPDYTVGTNEAMSRDDIELGCNRKCHCSLAVFHPVCIGETTYFSPCFAGCHLGSMLNHSTLIKRGLIISSTSSEAYEDCRCAQYLMTLNKSAYSRLDHRGHSVPLLAEKGRCAESSASCTYQYRLYLVSLTLSYCTALIMQSAHILIPIRCVDTNDKTFSLAIYQGAIALFAYIPYPLVYSYLVDSTCVLWEESCSTRGNCWVYDIKRFNGTLHYTTVICCALGAVCFLFVFAFSTRLDLFYVCDDENDVKVAENPKYTPTSGSISMTVSHSAKNNSQIRE
ncbi:solute carrier organic anion transporter family member 4C1-like [Varroa destructor]|uniref:Solute carrier organic anion transporter family member n=2 Tax=Varroa TaxID=62624 RepID=A0A7M7JRG3_VARDE|nr:solute carrier organic anion transporter family member 4C1-like [Varroa destructor]